MEKPKDRDFIETVDSLIFCVVGYLHPPEGYTAYLKYVPSNEGKWRRDSLRYRRVIPFYHVSQVESTYNYLLEKHSGYVNRCPVRNITISCVPKDKVEIYYQPRTQLEEIIRKGGSDLLEKRLIKLSDFLCDISSIGFEDIGITGSLLIKNHNPDFSDIDLTVYGMEASRMLKKAILEYRELGGIIQPHSRKKMREWSKSRAKIFPLNQDELMSFAIRRWNYGNFEGTYFSIHPVRVDNEIKENYGDCTYSQRGLVSGKAEIEDNSESIYMPAIYKLKNVDLDYGTEIEIDEIVSYEGLFCDMIRNGESVKFKGVLEHVKGIKEYNRVVIGSAGSIPGYIKPVK